MEMKPCLHCYLDSTTTLEYLSFVSLFLNRNTINIKKWSEYIVPCTLPKLLQQMSEQNSFVFMWHLENTNIKTKLFFLRQYKNQTSEMALDLCCSPGVNKTSDCGLDASTRGQRQPPTPAPALHAAAPSASRCLLGSATRARRCVVLDLPALEMDARSRTGKGSNLSLFFVPSGVRSISLAFGQAQGHPTSRDSILSHTAAGVWDRISGP